MSLQTEVVAKLLGLPLPPDPQPAEGVRARQLVALGAAGPDDLAGLRVDHDDPRAG